MGTADARLLIEDTCIGRLEVSPSPIFHSCSTVSSSTLHSGNSLKHPRLFLPIEEDKCAMAVIAHGHGESQPNRPSQHKTVLDFPPEFTGCAREGPFLGNKPAPRSQNALRNRFPIVLSQTKNSRPDCPGPWLWVGWSLQDRPTWTIDSQAKILGIVSTLGTWQT
jgi:hypothetical protein